MSDNHNAKQGDGKLDPQSDKSVTDGNPTGGSFTPDRPKTSESLKSLIAPVKTSSAKPESESSPSSISPKISTITGRVIPGKKTAQNESQADLVQQTTSGADLVPTSVPPEDEDLSGHSSSTPVHPTAPSLKELEAEGLFSWSSAQVMDVLEGDAEKAEPAQPPPNLEARISNTRLEAQTPPLESQSSGQPEAQPVETQTSEVAVADGSTPPESAQPEPPAQSVKPTITSSGLTAAIANRFGGKSSFTDLPPITPASESSTQDIPPVSIQEPTEEDAASTLSTLSPLTPLTPAAVPVPDQIPHAVPFPEPISIKAPAGYSDFNASGISDEEFFDDEQEETQPSEQLTLQTPAETAKSHPSPKSPPSYAASNRKSSLIGQTLFDNYAVMDLIGEGSYCFVYSAMQLNNDDVIAVKTPKLINPQIKERYQQAVVKQGRLKHPHIIKSLHYLESPDGQPFYMLENQQGVTLEEILQSVEKLDDEDAIALILTQTSSALEYAHHHQCTHDRLTPHNILLIDENEQLQVKVCDFQIAAVADITGDTTSKTRAFPYLSPETLSGGPITPQSDVYSLGAIAFRMATGHLPFDGRGRADSEQSPEPLARFSPELKRVQQLNDIVQEALDAEPQYRTDSIATFKQAIQEWIQAVHADDAAEPEYVTAEMPVPDFSSTSLPEQTIQAAPPEPERIVEYQAPPETYHAGFEQTPHVVPDPALNNVVPEVTPQQKRRIRRAQSRTGPQRIRSTIRELVALKKKQSNQEQTVVMKFTEQVAAQTAGPRRSPMATIARLVGFIVICGGLTVGCITYILTNPAQVREMYFQASRQLSTILPGKKTEIEEPVIEEGPKIVLEKPKRDVAPPQRKLKPNEIHATPQPWAIPRLPGQGSSSYNNPSSGVTNNSAQTKRRPSRVRIEYLNYDDQPK